MLLFIIIGIAVIAAGLFFLPKIGGLLSILPGFSDDYLYDEDFSRGYFDTNILEQSGTGSIQFVDDKMRILGNNLEKTITIREGRAGKFFKTKIQVVNLFAQDVARRSQSQITIYLNDVYIDTYSAFVPSSSAGVYNSIYIIEGIPSFENDEIYTIKVNGEESKVVNISNPEGDKKLKFTIKNSGWSDALLVEDNQFTSMFADIYYMKYKLPYSCEIKDDEILVFDSYMAGGIINYTSLAYKPEKFCLDYPVKARSFTENGIKTDIRGEILQKIARGESAKVPPQEEWKVYYITKYSSGMDLRCPIDQAYDTNSGTCQNPNEQVVVGCQTDSDCRIPSGCSGVTASCVQQECVFDGACVYQPSGGSESSIWDKILANGFFQWISGLFS